MIASKERAEIIALISGMKVSDESLWSVQNNRDIEVIAAIRAGGNT